MLRDIQLAAGDKETLSLFVPRMLQIIRYLAIYVAVVWGRLDAPSAPVYACGGNLPHT